MRWPAVDRSGGSGRGWISCGYENARAWTRTTPAPSDSLSFIRGQGPPGPARRRTLRHAHRRLRPGTTAQRPRPEAHARSLEVVQMTALPAECDMQHLVKVTKVEAVCQLSLGPSAESRDQHRLPTTRSSLVHSLCAGAQVPRGVTGLLPWPGGSPRLGAHPWRSRSQFPQAFRRGSTRAGDTDSRMRTCRWRVSSG